MQAFHPTPSASTVRLTRCAAALLLCLSAPCAALAQPETFPSRPIKLVVPYPAGGAADLIGRTVADGLSARYSQPVVVDNRPGAGGHRGAEFALQQPADGYTLVLATISHNGAYKMFSALRYDPPRDMQPLTLVAESPNVLLVREGLDVKTVPELLALARAQPGKLNYGSAGNGSATHMAGELFKHLGKVDVVAIPFAGGAPALAALLGGQVDLNFETGSTAQQAIRSRRVRALAVTTAQRSTTYPDLPALAEFIPGYAAAPWYTVSASSKLPEAIAARLAGDIAAVVKAPEAVARLQALGVVPLGSGRDEARQRNAVETKRWEAVIEAAKLKAE